MEGYEYSLRRIGCDNGSGTDVYEQSANDDEKCTNCGDLLNDHTVRCLPIKHSCDFKSANQNIHLRCFFQLFVFFMISGSVVQT